MNSKLNGRLEKLEAKLRAFSNQTIWVDLFDNRVRVDIGGKRGEEIEFDNVFDCVTWVENQIAQFERVAGLAVFSDISEFFDEGVPREVFNRIYEDAPGKSVVISLSALGGNSIEDVAYVSWWHSLSGIAHQEWRKEVERRVDIFVRALAGEGEADMP